MPITRTSGRSLLALVLAAALLLMAAPAPAQQPDAPPPPPQPQVDGATEDAEFGIMSFALRHAEVKDVLTALRSLVDARRLSMTDDPPRITVRDRPDRLRLAAYVVEQMDREPWSVHLKVELVSVSPALATEVAAAGGELSGHLEEQVRRQAGAPVAVGTVGLVGREAAEWMVSSREEGRDQVSVRAAGRLTAGERPVRLRLELRAAAPGEGGGFLSQTSYFQMADGATVALPILHRGTADPGKADAALVLVTPTIVEPGQLDAESVETFDPGDDAGQRVAAND